MNPFVAKNANQLDRCLRLLHSADIQFSVEVKETDKGKIFYEIIADESAQIIETLMERYRILIS